MNGFQTLYKRTKTGAIQFWQIEVVDSFTKEAAIKKTSGQVGTDNPITHIEVIKEGKNQGRANETTPLQQACFQAESDWKRKHDEGYKTFTDIMPDADAAEELTLSPDHLTALLQANMPAFNTDASGNIKPMLAQDWGGGKKAKYPCFIQPKLDGARCLMIINNEENSIITRFLSRSGKDYTSLIHIAHAVGIRGHELPKGVTILDGEIYSDELSFQEIMAALKKERPESKKLQFRAYDVVDDQPQGGRIVTMIALVKEINSPLVEAVGTMIISSKEEVMTWHQYFVEGGYEGAMLRIMDGKYGQGQRSSDLLKVKEFNENEYTFQRFELGQRDVEDLIAVCDMDGDGNVFRAKMMGNVKHKQGLYNKERQLTGKALTIKHFGFTNDGLPRFPIGKDFRED